MSGLFVEGDHSPVHLSFVSWVGLLPVSDRKHRVFVVAAEEELLVQGDRPIRQELQQLFLSSDLPHLDSDGELGDKCFRCNHAELGLPQGLDVLR